MKRVLTIMAVLVASANGLAAAAEPGEAVLAFITRLQNADAGVEDLMKETALSPYCGPLRRKAIELRLGSLAKIMRGGSREYAVLQEKQDGDFAAVLVSALSTHDPLEVDVLAFGLGRKGKEWKPAPMPGTFDNVDLGFDDDLKSRVDALEIWMGSERLRRLRVLYADAERGFRQRMAKAVPDPLLEKANPVQHVKAFLAACQEGNLSAVMRLLSEFEDGLTEEDLKLQRTIARGLQGQDSRARWKQLTSPNIVRVLVQEDPGDDLDAEVLILLFDPVSADPTSVLRFVMLKVGKRWEIELPTSLRLADEPRMQFQRALWRQEGAEDDEVRNRFEEFFEEQHTPRRSESLQEAGQQLEKILREGTLEGFFRYLHRSKDLSSSERRSAYRYLADFWAEFHEASEAPSDGELVGVLEDGRAGVAAFNIISTAQLERGKLLPLVLLREEDGWAIAPGVTTAGNYEELAAERRLEQDRVIATFLERKDALSKQAAKRFLERFVKASPKAGGTVSEEEAAKLVKTYRDRLRNGDLLEVFACCALLDPEEGAWEALKLLKYEHLGTVEARAPDRQLKVVTRKHWAAVSLRVDNGAGSVPVYPMYLVVSTPQGPRIVVDVGLRHATNKGRELINKRVWRRIGDLLDEEETALVRTLFQGHVERSKIDVTEWEKSNK